MTVRLHSATFSWHTHARLEIEWARGSGRPIEQLPKIENLSQAEEETDPEGLRGVPAMCWRNDAPALFEDFQLCENTEYLVDVTLPVNFDEAVRSCSTVPGWPFSSRLSTIFKADPSRRWLRNGDITTTIQGRLSLRDHAGVLDLSLGANLSLRAEVVCKKIGYLDEFRALLDAIAEELAELLLQFDNPTSSVFDFSDLSDATEAALIFQMRYIMAERNLPVALDEVRRSFHSGLQEHREHNTLEAADEPDIAAFLGELDEANFARGGMLSAMFRGHTPLRFPQLEMRESTDTPENRYVRHFLEELQLVAHRLASTMEKANRPSTRREVQSWITYLDEVLAENAWRPISPMRSYPGNSQVLQKRRGYKDILHYDMSLRMGLQLPWKRAEVFADGLVGDIRPVSELYEYWCFFMLRKAIASLATEDNSAPGSAFDTSNGKLEIRLQKGRRSRVHFSYSDSVTPFKINLFYNRVFPRPNRDAGWHGSYTSRFEPDYSLELVVGRHGEAQRHWLHFDAKYRTRMVAVGAAALEELQDTQVDMQGSDYVSEMARFHKQDDLFKMHTYRDGILGSRGAYILFPGDSAGMRLSGSTQNLFVRHPTAFDTTPLHLFPSVGAFEFCPGREAAQIPVLVEFLRGVFDAVSLGQPYSEERALF